MNINEMFPVFSIQINVWGHLEHRLVSARSAEEVPGIFKKFLENEREQSRLRGFRDNDTYAFIYNEIDWDRSDLLYALSVDRVQGVFADREDTCWEFGG